MAGTFTQNFLLYSRKIDYESDNTSELKVSKLRKLLGINYYELQNLKVDPELSCCAFQEASLKKYSAIVDDPDGINNYSSRVLALLPKHLTGNQNNWISSITAEDVCELLEPLPCSEDEPDVWSKLNCSNAGATSSDSETLLEARKSYKSQRRQQPVNDRSASSETNQGGRTESEVTAAFMPKHSLARKPAHQDVRNNESIPMPKRTEPFSQQDNTKVRGLTSFKTAGEELRKQNLKKFGKDSGRNEGQLSYGTGKKSLGSRKGGGIHSKFVPPIIREDRDEGKSEKGRQGDDEESEIDERLKNIDPKMVELIRSEIMDCGPKLTWNDIAGLEFAKTTIQEIVVWPMLRPDIFTGLRRPPKGILLFGPPGTGKTLIGKCIASQSGSSFFSISASSLTSKWIGDGEKMVRALFAVARVDQPSVVFIDEIDSLLSQRSDTEHESSRRLKTEFLVQLDGVGTGEEDRVLIIGATNRPQELDEAARRRLVKRLYIPLPDLNARAQMVQNLLANERHTLSDSDVKEVGELTAGYSGADVKHVCQEASLGPIRSIPAAQICAITSSQVRPVDISDFKNALTRVKSTVSPEDLNLYVTWDRQFGCGSL